MLSEFIIRVLASTLKDVSLNIKTPVTIEQVQSNILGLLSLFRSLGRYFFHEKRTVE